MKFRTFIHNSLGPLGWLAEYFAQKKDDREAAERVTSGSLAHSAQANIKYVDDATSGLDYTTGTSSDNDYPLNGDDFLSYLDGLFTSQGSENQINRDFNAAQNQINREFQSREAQIQRDWYEQQSSSAYTRAVADLRNAGLNPILAYSQGGAAASATGVPSGSAAAYTATGGDSISSILSSLADIISAVKGSSAKSYVSLGSLLKYLK